MTDEKPSKAKRGREEEGSGEMTDIKEQLKKLEVFADGQTVYDWESVALGDFPRIIVLSTTDLLLWGHEILQAIAETATVPIEKLMGADRVVAEWMDGRIEVMTDDETKTFTSRDGWQTYWRSLDEWPKEL
jgi:hypothetical protein